jgi:hypothetical protein
MFLKQDQDLGSGFGFKILISRIRIRPKMDRIRNPEFKCNQLKGYVLPVTYLLYSTIVSTTICIRSNFWDNHNILFKGQKYQIVYMP